MNFEIASAGYDMMAMNVVMHNDLRNSVAQYYARKRSILNSLTSYTCIFKTFRIFGILFYFVQAFQNI